jgi:hypothetical protein
MLQYLIIFFLLWKFFDILLCNGFKFRINSKFYFKYYKGKNLTKKSKVFEELKLISKNSIDLIPRYPIFNGDELDNKHIIIIYNNKNNPIATVIFFEWLYKKIKIYHMGLFLVSKKYKKNGLQRKLGILQCIVLLYNNYLREYYISDIGNSPSALKQIDKYLSYKCYPTLKKNINTNFIKLSKNIAKGFYDNHAINSAGCSKYSKYDYDKMVVLNANLKEGGGFHELVDFINNRQSKSSEYNDFVNNLLNSKYDEFIIIGKVSLFGTIYDSIKSLFF